MKSNLTIGYLAKTAGVNVETIRYYQRRGLIAQPPKPLTGYRTYPQEVLDRILFIKRAQELGFTLDEISTMLTLGEAHCHEVEEIARRRLADVRARIGDLRRLEHALNNLVLQCRINPDQSHCPIVDSFSPSGSLTT